MNAINSAVLFLLGIVFDAVIMLLLARLFLQKLCLPYNNPMWQSLLRLTDPVVLPLRKYISSFRGFDLAIVLCVVVLEVIQTCLSVALQWHQIPGPVLIFARDASCFGKQMHHAVFFTACCLKCCAVGSL